MANATGASGFPCAAGTQSCGQYQILANASGVSSRSARRGALHSAAQASALRRLPTHQWVFSPPGRGSIASGAVVAPSGIRPASSCSRSAFANQYSRSDST